MALYQLTDSNKLHLQIFLSRVSYSGQNDFLEVRELHEIMTSLSNPIDAKMLEDLILEKPEERDD